MDKKLEKKPLDKNKSTEDVRFKNILQIGILTDAYKKALEQRKEQKNAK